MSKRTILHFALTLVLLALALAYSNRDKDSLLLGQFAQSVSSYLEKQAADAASWTEAARKSGFEADRNSPLLADGSSKDFTVFVQQGDSIVFWSNNRALPERDDLLRLAKIPPKSLVQLPMGYYCALRQSAGNQSVTTLIPIKYTFAADSVRQRFFPADPTMPSQINLSVRPTPFAVALGGEPVCWLEATDKIRYSPTQWMAFWSWVLFLCSFFALVNKASMWAAARYRPVVGSAVLLGSVALVLWANDYFGMTAVRLDALSMFARKFDSPGLGNSLGEWILYIIVMLWLMVFFHREFTVKPTGQLPGSLRVAFGVLYNLAMMMSILVGIVLFRQLMFESGINFDFDNILNLDRFAKLAILGVVLLLAGLFLFSHRMMQTVFRNQLSRKQRALSLSVAALITLPICYQLQSSLDVQATYVVAFALTYVITFDYFIENKSPGFGWIVGWLFIFSAFTALLLYRYNNTNDLNNRLACAIELAQPRDEKVAEPLLERLHERLKDDRKIDSLIRPVRFDTSKAVLQNYIAKRVFAENYLFQHYRTDVFVFDTLGQPAQTDQLWSRDEVVRKRWDKALPVHGSPGLRWLTDSLGNFQYILHRRAFRQNERAFPVDVYVFFAHEYPTATKVYSELYYNQPFKKLPLLKNYDFAIFKNGKAVVTRGTINPVLYNPQNFPPPDQYEDLTMTGFNSRTDLIYTDRNGFTVVVGRAMGGNLKRLYLFSSLFALLSVFMILLGMANSYVRVLPDYYQFYLNTKGSLAKRIQYYMVGLVLAAVIFIGYLTFRHFTDAAEKNELKSLEYRTEAMRTHLLPYTLPMQPSPDTLRRVLPRLLADMANSFSIDVHLYSIDGELISTTQEDLRRVGVLSRKMNAHAWQQLRSQSAAAVMEQESAGTYLFSTKYVALRNRDNTLLGFVGLPYYLSGRSVSADLSDFLGILASLYVFLLIIAGVATFFVARSIIKPIQLIAGEITKLRLEDKNLPLAYSGDGQDELSTLIEEYNRMVDKLEDSKLKLIKLEREGAWKEMARQVAHDIKNPLTAMKLSMQQLERVAGSNFEQARDYLKIAIGRLIEQIDSLAHIASDFSLFAKLDITHKHDLVINDLVENVFDLFSETPNIDFEKDIPTEKIHVFGDKSHLMRVFNNLIINATQAIPTDRRGKIHVAIHTENGRVAIKMSDNGGGIPPEAVRRIFEPNFTTKNTGSGLGLAICKKIVEVHDGDIWFETRPNDGTDFYVSLPLAGERVN